MRAAERTYVSNGVDALDRARRRRVGERLDLDMAAERLGGARHRWLAPTDGRVDGGRLVAIPDPLDRIVLGAMQARCLRYPGLAALAPSAFAYLGGRGPRAALIAAIDGVVKLSTTHDHVAVATVDLKRAYRSIPPRVALQRMSAIGMSRSLITALASYYKLLQVEPFAGTQEGPPTSPVMADLALVALDERIRASADLLVRYSDNLFVAVGGSDEHALKLLIENAVAEFNHVERAALDPHGWEFSIYSQAGGYEDAVPWMGAVLAGTTVQPTAKRVGRLKNAVARADGDLHQVRSIVSGFAAEFRGAVPDGVIQRALATALGEIAAPYVDDDSLRANKSEETADLLGLRSLFSLGVEGHPSVARLIGSKAASPAQGFALGDANRRGREGAAGRAAAPSRSHQRVRRRRRHPSWCRRQPRDIHGEALSGDAWRAQHRDIAALYFEHPNSLGFEITDLVSDEAYLHAFTLVAADFRREADAEIVEPVGVGEGGYAYQDSHLVFGLCSECARREARAFLYADYYEVEIAAKSSPPLPDVHLLRAAALIIRPDHQVLREVGALIHDRVHDRISDSKADAAMDSLRRRSRVGRQLTA